jgi:hypothetical protein
MGKRMTATLFSAGAAALTIGLGATSALAAAAATWTVSPGGAITGKAGTTTLTDTTSKISLSCTSSKLAGSLKSGKGLPGKGLGTVTSVAFNKCTVLSFTISLSSGNVAWKLNASSYKAATGTTSGTITGIHLAVQSSVCSAVVDGTGATARNGMVSVSYSNKTHVLKILPKGNLHVYKVSGCGGAISNGDAGDDHRQLQGEPAPEDHQPLSGITGI